MSASLPDACTDFQACQFFQQCKQELRRIAQAHNLQKNIKKTITKLKQSQANSTKTQQLDIMLFTNIVIDYLRSMRLDYTYTVFMQECNIIPEEVVGKNKLAVLIGVDEQYGRGERFNISLIQLMAKKLEVLRKRSKELVENGTQVEIVKRNGEQNHILLIENKMREVRQQVELRQRKYYEKQLENMRAREIMSLRAEIAKQFQQKSRSQREKLDKRYKEIIQKSKSSQLSSALKQENDRLLNKNYEITQQISKLKAQNEQIKKQKTKHDCRKSEDYKKLIQSIKKQKKEIQEKKKELDYALKNISTKVEDLVAQKKKVQAQRQTDIFQQELKVNKQNKDYMIESIYAEMKQMELRVKVLVEENNQLRETVRELKSNIKHKQQFYAQIREQSLVNTLTNQEPYGIFSGLESGDIGLDSDIIKKTSPILPENRYNRQYISTISPNCSQCQRRKLQRDIMKQKLVNVCVGVNEEDFLEEVEEVLGQDIQDDDYQERMRKELEYKKKLAKLNSMKNMLKNQTLLLVQADDF